MTVIQLPGAATVPVKQAPRRGRFPSMVTHIGNAIDKKSHAEGLVQAVAYWEEKLALFEDHVAFCRQELTLAKQREHTLHNGK